MEKCCDACGDGEYYCRSGFSTIHCDGISEATTAVDRKSTGHTLVSYSGKTPIFCVFRVFSVAVMEKCCDACGDGEYLYRSGFWTLQCDGVSEASTAVDRMSMGDTLVSYSGMTQTSSLFLVISVAVMEKCCDACGDGEYYFGSELSTLQSDGVSEASTAVDGKSMGRTVGERSWKDADFLCVS